MNVEVVNLTKRLALLDDGRSCRVDTLLDADGDETDEPRDAVVAILALPDGRWGVIDLRDFEPREPH